MAIKTFKYFDAGVGFKDQASDTITTNGVVYRNGNSLKLYIQNALRNIVTDTQTQTLTNKTIDVASNTISNIATANLATGVLNTSTSLASASNTQIPSALAVKTYVDAGLATVNDASEIAVVPTGTIAATNVQAAIAELDGDIQGHINNATGAHAASAISNTPSGNLAATTVQAALNELQGDINTDVTNLSNHISNATGAHAASAISNTPSGNLAAVNVQTALNELQSDIDTRRLTAENLVLSNLYHLEAQAATDAATTGSNASLAAFTAGNLRLTNGSLVSLANIPAGANGQSLVIFNRTGVDVNIVDSSLAVGTAANRIFTGTSANITFSKDAALALSYDSTSARWQIVGGSGSGGSSEFPIDTLLQQTFETAVLTDFTQTGLTLATTNPIKSTKSAQLISAGVTQSFKQVKSVDRQFRGKNNTLSLYTRSSATQGNVTILIFDETNAVNLAASQPITLGSTTVSVTTNTSTNLTGISTTDINLLKVGQTITGAGIPSGTIITAINTSSATISQAATASATITAKISALPARQAFTFDIPANCASISYTISALAETGSPESYFDDISIKLTETAKTNTSVTQTVFNTTEWAAYTPTFTNLGTVTGIEFEWRQIGVNYEIRGKAICGTPTGSPAQITLPFLANSAGTAIIPSAQVIGPLYTGATANQNTVILQPSVNYLTFGVQSAGAVGVTPLAASSMFSNANSFSFYVSVPIAGLTATSTVSKTIDLTSAQLVQTPDSTVLLTGGTMSGASTPMAFTTLSKNTGNAFSVNLSLGRVTVLLDGTYNISATSSWGSGTAGHQIRINGVEQFAPVGSATSGLGLNSSAQLALKANDYIDLINWSTGSVTSGQLNVSYLGSLKQLNVSSDSKITIPTHQLRFEGASARGSTDTAIVKFDTQAITQGDAWDVVNTAANGTVVTMKKAGKLSVTTAIGSGGTFQITKNQSTLTAISSIASEIMATLPAASTNSTSISNTFDVVVGDKIRVANNTAVTANTGNNLALSLTENSIPANFSNVLPQWSQSDSAVRLDTGNGFGSTNTAVRRFANNPDNLGTAVTYADSATLGASATINEDGLYDISYTEEGTASSAVLITKNLTTNTPGTNVLSVAYITSTAVLETASCQVYLLKGDVIRAIAGTPASVSASSVSVKFTISKVGKPNLSSVDVTSFVNLKTIDIEAIEALTPSTTSGSTNTGVPVLNITRNTNLGIIRIDSSATNGTSFVALKDCTININASADVTANTFVYITKNATILTATAPDGIIERVAANGTNGSAFIGTQIKVVAGDIIRFQKAAAAAANWNYLTLTAQADNNATASPTQQVSSDTMSFAFKATAIDPSVDPVGTFNTFTYAINTNTPTISASAPTQTTSDMNVNGVRIFSRAYNTTSTTASPAKVDIFIGKGLKSSQVSAYVNTGKSFIISTDLTVATINTDERGSRILYNETTGILSLDSGFNSYSGVTSKVVGLDIVNNTAPTSGYFVFSASKSPSLVTIPNLQQRVAYLSDVKANGTAGGASIAGTQTRTLNTIVDSTGIVTSLASNQFVLSAGTYLIEASTPAFTVNRHRARLRNITDSTTALLGSSEYALSTGAQSRSVIVGEVVITSSKTFELQQYTGNAVATNGLGIETSSGESEVYSQVKITKIK